MRRGGFTCWRCAARDSKCPAKLRCDSTVKTVIEQTRRHNHPQSFDYNAADGSYPATVEENIAERRKDQYFFSAAETPPNVTIRRTNSESVPRCSTEGMPRLAPAIGYPSYQGDRMWPKQLNLFGTRMYSSEATDNISNALLIPETSNNGSVSSFCSNELPIIQSAVEAKDARNMALEQSQQPGTSSNSFQGHAVDDVQFTGMMPPGGVSWRNQFHKVISSHHQSQANVPVASPIPETSNNGYVSSFCSTEPPVIQRNRSEIVPAQQQFSGAVETKATLNMALGQSQQPGTSSSSFQGHSADDVQFIRTMPAGGVSMRNQFRGVLSTATHYQEQVNVPVGCPAMVAEFSGVTLKFMGSFICVKCRQGITMCNRCPKNTMCRTCCKHNFFY